MLLLLMALACSPGSGKGSFTRPVDGDSGAVGTDGADGSADGDWTGLRDDEVESITGLPTDSAVLFNEDELPVFELEISDDSLANLRTDPYEYTEATLIWQGVRFGPIGIRTKGENSWRPFSEKSSFKLDFNRYDEGPDRFLGLKGLTFQGMNEDYSMMHERVAYRIYRMAGVPASRAHHAVIYVNGELYGLFTMIDTLDDIFLKGWFDEPLGSMWEQHDGDFTDAYVQNNLYFQHEVGEDDRTSLQAVADALESSGPEALAAAGEYLDWDAFHRYWAASSIAMNFDAYPFRFAGDDCHVYFDPARGKLVYLPHGTDETFYYDDNFEGRATGHLSARCREVPECRDAWANRVYDTLELAESEDIAGYAQEVAEQIRPWVEADPNRNYSLSNVNAYQADMISKLQNRRASVVYWIGERPEG
jgi:hypothetical protein